MKEIAKSGFLNSDVESNIFIRALKRIENKQEFNSLNMLLIKNCANNKKSFYTNNKRNKFQRY